MPGSETTSTSTSLVLWAQRRNCIYLNIQIEDIQNPQVKIEKDRVSLTANGGLDKKDHSVVLNLKEEIKADESKYFIRGRGCEVILMKTDETAPYWIRLLKEPTKFHWLRVDFNKWQDEDDSGDEASGPGGFGGGGADFEEMMRSMGGLGGGGMPGMDFGGAGLDNFEENDSDEEGLPDLEDGTPEDNKDQTDGDKTTKADDTKVGSENPTGAASDATA